MRTFVQDESSSCEKSGKKKKSSPSIPTPLGTSSPPQKQPKLVIRSSGKTFNIYARTTFNIYAPSRRGYNFICPIKTPEDVALPVEPLYALLMELLDAPPVEAEPEVAPAPRRPRRVTQVPRNLSAEGDSPITPPNCRARAHTRVALS
ncbi:hypothetical protein OUZ56_016984 [Daphnia magna]|uniref:Uncharacterized protein n=1 Tax=Daphnia magna TaxID=35525 RepID=A0ABR0ARU7_9CRUS|nr:hypothetical protein OUZ56_016984 [Daphnia magna]